MALEIGTVAPGRMGYEIAPFLVAERASGRNDSYAQKVAAKKEILI